MTMEEGSIYWVRIKPQYSQCGPWFISTVSRPTIKMHGCINCGAQWGDDGCILMPDSSISKSIFGFSCEGNVNLLDQSWLEVGPRINPPSDKEAFMQTVHEWVQGEHDFACRPFGDKNL